MRVKTANQKLAGTDEKVSLRLMGNWCNWQKAQPLTDEHKDTFERNAGDNFKFKRGFVGNYVSTSIQYSLCAPLASHDVMKDRRGCY